jgi:hypothetical protein
MPILGSIAPSPRSFGMFGFDPGAALVTYVYTTGAFTIYAPMGANTVRTTLVGRGGAGAPNGTYYEFYSDGEGSSSISYPTGGPGGGGGGAMRGTNFITDDSEFNTTDIYRYSAISGNFTSSSLVNALTIDGEYYSLYAQVFFGNPGGWLSDAGTYGNESWEYYIPFAGSGGGVQSFGIGTIVNGSASGSPGTLNEYNTHTASAVNGGAGGGRAAFTGVDGAIGGLGGTPSSYTGKVGTGLGAGGGGTAAIAPGGLVGGAGTDGTIIIEFFA